MGTTTSFVIPFQEFLEIQTLTTSTRFSKAARSGAPLFIGGYQHWLEPKMPNSGTNPNLLHRIEIKLLRSFFVEQRALFLIAAAPVLVTSGDAQEVSSADAFLAVFVFVEIRTFNHDDRNIVGVGMHSGVVSRFELCECRMRTRGGVSKHWRSGDVRVLLHGGVIRLCRINKHDLAFCLSLHPPYCPGHDQSGHHRSYEE